MACCFAERRILNGWGGVHPHLPRGASRLACPAQRQTKQQRLRLGPGCLGKRRRDVIDWIGVMMAMFAVGTVVAVYLTGM
jgi:hypothetical protein